MRRAAVVAAAFVSGALAINAQRPEDMPFRVERLNPALDAIVAAGAKLELLGDRFALTEGPVWVPEGDGYLLFSDNAANVIYKWASGQPLTVFLEKSGYTRRAREAARRRSRCAWHLPEWHHAVAG